MRFVKFYFQLFSNFFFISTSAFHFAAICAWSLIYHSFEICQILFQSFFDFFINRLPVELGLFRRQGFKLPHNFKIANLNSKIFAFFMLFNLFQAVLSLFYCVMALYNQFVFLSFCSLQTLLCHIILTDIGSQSSSI